MKKFGNKKILLGEVQTIKPEDIEVSMLKDNKELRELLEYKNDEIERLKIYINDFEVVKEYNDKEYNELQNRIDKALDYLEMCKTFALVDKKIILSVSTLERILKGDNKDENS